jgi:hypothetical protein
MANGAEPVGGRCGFRYVIYIRPSGDLIAQSWSWPPAWHRAFERAAGQLGRAVAFCILQGLPPTRRVIAQQLPVDCLRFSVRCRETSVYISISAFTGPHAPRPDGGLRQQPYAAHGLVLGLRGSGKSFSLVVFQGRMPLPVEGGPATNRANERRVYGFTYRANENRIYRHYPTGNDHQDSQHLH